MRPVEYCKKRIIRFHRVFSEIFKCLRKSSLFGDLENFWGLEKIRFFCFCNMRCFFFDKNVIQHVRNLSVTKYQMSELFAHFRQPCAVVGKCWQMVEKCFDFSTTFFRSRKYQSRSRQFSLDLTDHTKKSCWTYFLYHIS